MNYAKDLIENKKGNLETTLNMGYFDVQNNIVIDLTRKKLKGFIIFYIRGVSSAG